MKQVSKRYLLIANICNAIHDHKLHCDTNCNVSIGLLVDAANELLKTASLKEIPESEIVELATMITNTPRF